MILSREMLTFKPKMQKNFIQYLRKDKDNNYTLKLSVNKNNEKVINQSFLDIMNNFNGENTIEEVIEKMLKLYDDVENELISNDVISVLYNIIEMKGLEPSEDNPFINRFRSKVSEDSEIYLVQYTDAKKIKPLISNVYNINQVDTYNIYNNPYIYEEEIDYFKTIYEANDNNEIVFAISNNDIITGIIVYSLYSNSVFTLKHAIFPKNDTNVHLYFKRTLATTVKVAKKKPECIRIYFKEFDSSYIKDSLKYIGFQETAYLKDELGKDVNLSELSYYI